MKNILVPTDFSNNAYNALLYALNIAETTKAEVTVLNAYHMPHSGANVMINISDVLKNDSIQGLNEVEKKLKQSNEFDNVPIKFISDYGLAKDVICALAKKDNYDMIVMGTKGESNLASKLLGSVTSHVIKSATCPVLAVPVDKKYNSPSNLVLATDFDLSNDNGLLDPLLDIAKSVNGKISILNIASNVSDSADDVLSKHKETYIENEMSDVLHSYHFIQNDDIQDGLVKFMKENDGQILALIKKKYGFFENLFHKSVTKQMALHATFPLLVL